MGTFNIKTTANLRSIRQLERNIQKGIEAAGEDIEDYLERAARHHVRMADAMWTKELLHSFHSETVSSGKVQRTTVWNSSEHAPYVEYGARYTVRKPPISALLPWVETKLGGYELVPDKNGDPALRPIFA
jgi:hypothetical protein